jgi:uncharacterized protein (TIGR02996 family)
MILTSPTARGLLRAILEDPFDDVPRLLLADVLEEAGDPRGEFIHVQAKLADPSAWKMDETCGKPNRDGPCLNLLRASRSLWSEECLWCKTRRREQELLDEYGFDWFGQFTKTAGVDEGRGPDRNAWNFRSLGGTLGWCHFRRGFVASVTLTCADWCGAECQSCQPPGRVIFFRDCLRCHGTGRTGGHGPALVLAAPIEEVVLSDVLPREVRSATASRWWFVGDTHVPAKLLNLANQSGIGIPPGHTTPQAASAVLSRAALRWARQEAGLPALS